MRKPKIFVSFDFENDKKYKYLLTAFSNNKDFDISFDDKSSKEINSWNISTVKGALTRKINEATHTLVIVGEEARTRHADHKDIGYNNWLSFEIAKSKENNNKLIGVKLNNNYQSPEELKNSGAAWATSFTVDQIKIALKK